MWAINVFPLFISILSSDEISDSHFKQLHNMHRQKALLKNRMTCKSNKSAITTVRNVTV